MPTQSQGSVSQPFGYTGEQRDAESGLVYLRARMYDPAIGRFLQRDPLSGHGLRPQTLNKYPYVTNRPIHLTDPSGLVTWGLGFSGSAGVGVGGTVSGMIVWDDQGNIGILFGAGGGGYIVETASVGSVLQYTTAQCIFSLPSPTIYSGASIGEGLGVGYDLLVGSNTDGSPYVGFQVQISLTAKSPLPVELHGGGQAGVIPISVNIPGLIQKLSAFWRQGYHSVPGLPPVQKPK